MQLNTVELALSQSDIIEAVPDQVSCDLGGEEVILDLNSGVYYGLDSIGSRIWSLIQEPQPISRVIEALLTEYDVEPAQCEGEVFEFLQQLIDRGLVKIRA